MTELYSKRNPEWTGGEMGWNAFVNDGGIVYDKEIIETKTKRGMRGRPPLHIKKHSHVFPKNSGSESVESVTVSPQDTTGTPIHSRTCFGRGGAEL